MRLVCPNCAAKYEVDDGAIPDEGRDVQCANCGETWFQDAATVVSEPAEPESLPDDDAPSEATPPGTDQSVLDILRKEAELDAEVRDTPPVAEPEEEEPADEDGNLAARAKSVRARMNSGRDSKRGTRRASAEAAEDDVGAAPKRQRKSGRDPQLPDVDSLNSTLRSSKDKRRENQPEPLEAETKRGRSRLGTYLAFLIFLLLLAAYVLQDQIVAAAPEAEPYLKNYVDTINQMRRWLANMAGTISDAVKNLIDQYS